MLCGFALVKQRTKKILLKNKYGRQQDISIHQMLGLQS